MINFRILDPDESLEKLALSEEIFYPVDTSLRKVIAEEEGQILGLIFYEICTRICRIEKVWMLTIDDVVKEALVRTLLHAMDLRGIRTIIAKNESDDSFFCSLGFYPLFLMPDMIDLDLKESDYRMIDTREFFNRNSCRHDGGFGGS